MKRIVTMAMSATMVFYAGATLAQDDEQSEPLSFTPVEAYACNFNEGKGPADLAAVVEEWNEWMDSQGSNSYFAATMWPNYFGERSFDVAWVGAWSDGNAMGAGTDLWLTSGQEVGAGFYDVLDCMSHTQFASVQTKEPPEVDMERGEMFVATFSDCSMQEDVEYEDYLAAQKEWNTYADEHGFVGGAWNWWPVWGESADADYDFKAVSSAPNYTAVGANWAKFAEGHYQKSNEIFEGLLDCDSPRVYTMMVERLMEDDD
jgi:hypothetical protein